MQYIVIEIQTNPDGTIGIPAPAAYEDYYAAEQKYHTILAAAAVSALPSHAAAILLPDGTVHKHQCYVHGGAE